jgi:hypothetical protein
MKQFLIFVSTLVCFLADYQAALHCGKNICEEK